MAKQPQRLSSLPLVAIDLGSNGIRAMAAESLGPNMLHILGFEQTSQHPGVDRGVVVQTAGTGFMIGDVLKKLGNRIGVPNLPAAFTLLGGRSMQVVHTFSKRDLVQRRSISEHLLQEMEHECKSKIEQHNPNVAVLGLCPAYYVLDGVEQDERPQPSDRATLIEAHYTAFVGHSDLEQKVLDSFTRAAKTLEHAFVRPDALFSAFSVEDNTILEEGCAIIDFGAQTTTLSIYKHNQYITTKVVPLGGWNITRFIEQQGVSLAVAEKMKCQYGYAAPQFVERNLRMTIPGTDIQLTSQDLASTIKMKLDEILAPILTEIKQYEQRISTIYITGGGSLLAGLCEYLQSLTPVTVAYGSHAGLLDRLTPDEFCSPEYASLVGALIMGADYRAEHGDDVLPERDSLLKQLKRKFQEETIDLFSNPNE